MGTLLEAIAIGISYRYCVRNLFWIWVSNAYSIGDSLNGTPYNTKDLKAPAVQLLTSGVAFYGGAEVLKNIWQNTASVMSQRTRAAGRGIRTA